MSMVGPFACTECTLGRCVKPLTRCDECETRVIQANTNGRTTTGKLVMVTHPPGHKYIGNRSGARYDCLLLQRHAHKLSTELGNLCHFEDSPHKNALHEVYEYLVEISHTGVL
jgi:hypothetical protein